MNSDPFSLPNVFAVRGDPLEIVDLLPWLCATVFAIVGLVVAAYFLRFLRNWRLEEPDDANALLTKFRRLHEDGKLSAEEYRNIRTTLAEQVKRQEEESQTGQ